MITCRFENNNEATLRHVTVDGIVIKNEKILLVRRAAHLAKEPNKFSLPGGFLDRNETTKGGVLRELLEETGYEGEEVELFVIKDGPRSKGDDRQNVGFVFLIKAGEKIGISDDEVESASWFDIDKLPERKEFAFDHYSIVEKYLKYRINKFNLPAIISE